MGKIGFSKLKYNGHVTFFNLASEEDAIESAKILNNSIFKKENVNAEVIVKKGENEKKVLKFLLIELASELFGFDAGTGGIYGEWFAYDPPNN